MHGSFYFGFDPLEDDSAAQRFPQTVTAPPVTSPFDTFEERRERLENALRDLPTGEVWIRAENGETQCRW